MPGERMTARERGMPRRTERRHEARTDRRRPDTTELLLVEEVKEIADREPATDQLDRVRPPLGVDAHEAHDVGRKPVRLAIDLCQILVAVVLHIIEQIIDLVLDRL